MCWSYNRQHGPKFLAVMPTNLYAPETLTTCKLARAARADPQIHEAKQGGARQ